MQSKNLTKIALLICLSWLTQPAATQDSNRWLRIPMTGKAEIIRHPLSGASAYGKTLRFQYETDPVTPLLKIIRKNFPETRAIDASYSQEIMDTGKSTILLEKMQLEAENNLMNATDTIQEANASEAASLF